MRAQPGLAPLEVGAELAVLGGEAADAAVEHAHRSRLLRRHRRCFDSVLRGCGVAIVWGIKSLVLCLPVSLVRARARLFSWAVGGRKSPERRMGAPREWSDIGPHWANRDELMDGLCLKLSC